MFRSIAIQVQTMAHSLIPRERLLPIFKFEHAHLTKTVRMDAPTSGQRPDMVPVEVCCLLGLAIVPQIKSVAMIFNSIVPNCALSLCLGFASWTGPGADGFCGAYRGFPLCRCLERALVTHIDHLRLRSSYRYRIRWH